MKVIRVRKGCKAGKDLRVKPATRVTKVIVASVVIRVIKAFPAVTGRTVSPVCRVIRALMVHRVFRVYRVCSVWVSCQKNRTMKPRRSFCLNGKAVSSKSNMVTPISSVTTCMSSTITMNKAASVTRMSAV